MVASYEQADRITIAYYRPKGKYCKPKVRKGKKQNKIFFPQSKTIQNRRRKRK